MTPVQATTSIKNVIAESFALNPSALITLFEIDIAEIGFNAGVISSTDIISENNTVFRFHNSLNSTTNSLFWQGKEYIAAPIFAEGFEITAKGALNNPKISITVDEIGIPYLSRLKDRIRELGDIVGGKITRIRTFARFLDEANFVGGIPPKEFSPDPNSEFPRDVFYIDRKSKEDKFSIEYELGVIFDVQDIKLPGRMVTVNNCPFSYRGEGCLYEYAARKNPEIHGDGNLPQSAPPIANILDEKFSSLLPGVAFVDKGQYNVGQIYAKGEFVYLTHRGMNYYFVSKIDNNTNVPLDTKNWLIDECSKKVFGCKLRWNNVGDGTLPYGGFLSVNRFR